MAQRICSVEGCGRPHKAQGLCPAHYERQRKGKDLAPPVHQYEFGGICKVEGCDQPRAPRGGGGRSGTSADYCPMHRQRVLRHGAAGAAARERSPSGEAIWNTAEYRRRYSRLKKYGITPEEFDQILAQQGGRCGICQRKDPANNRVQTWCVDHDHVTGQVRGLLCAHCNRALGLFGDDPKVLTGALRYVIKHRQMQLFGPAGPIQA